jgi:hypothetical protein
MPKHKSGRYVRSDPSGGGQWRFWALIVFAVIVAVGILVALHADRIAP